MVDMESTYKALEEAITLKSDPKTKHYRIGDHLTTPEISGTIQMIDDKYLYVQPKYRRSLVKVNRKSLGEL